MDNKEHQDIDRVSGIPTTGHEWDGIKELNNPLPRWWLWTFYLTVIWSLGYFVLYPAWPTLTGYTPGLLGHSQRQSALDDHAASIQARLQLGQGLADAELQQIRDDPKLLEFAQANGRAAFGDNCAPCHGSGATGSPGYPNLQDDDWLWGGTLDDIHLTLVTGIRSTHPETRLNDMPAFGRDGILGREEIRQVANYVLSLSDQPTSEGVDIAAGEVIFAEQCSGCHGDDGRGIRELGGPNLADAIWLFGGDETSVIDSITNSRRGVMPAWADRLDPVTIKSLAVYVHSLGGGV